MWLRRLALCGAGVCLWTACSRGAQVEALPLPDAEPPVVIIGPGRDSGVRPPKTKGRPDAAPKADAAAREAPLDAGVAIAAVTPPLPVTPAPSATPSAARPSGGVRATVDEDGTPLYTLDESGEAAAERDAPPSREPAPPRATDPPRDPDPPASEAPPRAIAPAGQVTSGAKGPLVVVDGESGRIEVMSREVELLGRIDLGSAVVRGVAHDRRAGDGVWILVSGSPPMIAKIGWDGRRIRGYEVKRPPLRRARSFLGVDYVMGHTPSSDLLLVLYINKLGLPVLEGLLLRDGSSRFTVGFSREADVSGVRAEGFRHDAVDGLLVMDWWTIRAGDHLERWRFFYGFVDRMDDRRLATRIDAFDIPPWREVWGADRGGRRVVRLSGDGEVVQTYPARGVVPAFLAISP